MSDESKRYTDREVALVIQAALDLEKKEAGAGSGGLSLAELEEIASETGISVDHLRLAAERIAGRAKKSAAQLLFGAETSFEKDEIVPQALSREELDRLDESLPALTSLSESSVVKGGSLTWKRGILKSLLDGFPLSLSVKEAEGGTRITARATLNSMASVFFAASGGIGILAGIKIAAAAILLIGTGAIGLPLSAVVLAGGGLVGLGGAWLLARLAFRSFAKRSRDKVATIVDKIKASIQAKGK